ncbi:MAG TPA: hypothetical protein VEH06_11955 [Candidatus Bathyarchaeia archaeon]|nr:hypothetical protein [Candidatus Bathyarchaeia archaeon]
MISTKQRTIALSSIGIAAAIALFASLPLLAYAFWGPWGWGSGEYGGGWGVNRCAWFGCGVGSGGWFPWGPSTPSWNG